jgi:hypothetical protein
MNNFALLFETTKEQTIWPDSIIAHLAVSCLRAAKQ